MNHSGIIIDTTILLGQSWVCEKSLAAQFVKRSNEHPNFLLLLTDDQSYHLSLVVTPGIKTPNMDRLANRGEYH